MLEGNLARIRKAAKSHSERNFAQAVAMLGFGKTLKWPGRHKGKLQDETLARIKDAAALVFLKYPQRKMIPLLYPKQHDPEAGRKAVQIFLKRNRSAILDIVKTMTHEQAEQISKSLPRDIN
jgi:hypothetical protein